MTILYFIFLVCMFLGVCDGIKQLKTNRYNGPTTTNLLDYIFDTRY